MKLTKVEAIEQRRCQKCGGHKFEATYRANARFTTKDEEMILFGKNWETEEIIEVECKTCGYYVPKNQFDKWVW